MVGENDRNFFFYFQRVMFALVILFFVVYSLFPVVWGISTSFKTLEEVETTPITYLPERPTFDNYIEALENTTFTRSILNSALIATGATSLSLVVGGLAAYA
ncbi:MAG: carbohydrate ABC transporter permease, partial [Chloroflexota bacterium]